MSATVLIIEDDMTLREGLREAMTQAAHAVMVAATAREGLERLRNEEPALLVLDLGLPDQDGLSVLRELRRDGYLLPVLLLTARGDPQARADGLDAGADDYLVKPFHLVELQARVRALLRRAVNTGASDTTSPLVVDPDRRRVRFRDDWIELTQAECAVLQVMLGRRNATCARAQLESALARPGRPAGSNALDVHIHRLRRKLAPELIRTVHGEGYRLVTGDGT